jgi:hypothetical protein
MRNVTVVNGPSWNEEINQWCTDNIGEYAPYDFYMGEASQSWPWHYIPGGQNGESVPNQNTWLFIRPEDATLFSLRWC